MALIVAGPLLGVAFGQVFTSLRETVKDTVSKVCQFKPILERLQSTLDRLAPMVDQMVELSEKLDLPERETKRLKEHMEEGVKLVRKCLTVRWWNYVFKFKYSSKLKDLDDEIIRYCWLDLIAQCARNGLMTLENSQNMTRMLKILMNREIPRPVSCAVRERTEFTVGLDMTIRELKTLLLKEKVRLLLLTAPGGCGKTKLVEMLCQDEQIKGTSKYCLHIVEVIYGASTFKENILFVTVSKTPNVKVIVQNLFSHKGLQPKFEIQSEENAIDQLLQLLENIGPDPILLILDDVWQESLPEKFEFNIPNYKIIATSRIAFPRFKNFRYNLKPLNKKDAMTLFCHSAELQDESSNIPEKDIKKMDDEEVKFEVYYGGTFLWNPSLEYFNRKVEIVDKNPNRLSYFEIEGICEELGIDEPSRVHYLAPGGNLEQDLRLIEDDIDMVSMSKLNEGGPRDTIILYVESGHAPLAIEVPNEVG
ncbi:putative disease resistance protein [Quercus suber]|uniref:Disease resistance protein n=1 Tax=Quercus suber TaxID=58331 RepID=A0AAW0LD21_QUESU